MASGEVTPLEDEEEKEFSIHSRNSKIEELLELCIQPKNKKDKETIVSDFWNEFQTFSRNKRFCEFDIACLYAFNYVYKENSVSLSAISRSVRAYLDQNRLALINENRNRFIDCFLTGLRNFKNFDSEEGMTILAQSLIGCLMDGNAGFAHFLVKFNLVDFPSEDNDKSRKMLVELV